MPKPPAGCWTIPTPIWLKSRPWDRGLRQRGQPSGGHGWAAGFIRRSVSPAAIEPFIWPAAAKPDPLGPGAGFTGPSWARFSVFRGYGGPHAVLEGAHKKYGKVSYSAPAANPVSPAWQTPHRPFPVRAGRGNGVSHLRACWSLSSWSAPWRLFALGRRTWKRRPAPSS